MTTTHYLVESINPEGEVVWSEWRKLEPGGNWHCLGDARWISAGQSLIQPTQREAILAYQNFHNAEWDRLSALAQTARNHVLAASAALGKLREGEKT